MGAFLLLLRKARARRNFNSMRTALLWLVLLPGLVLAQEAEQAPPAEPQASAPKKPTKEQVYKWVDKNGVVHYSGTPPADGAAPARLPPLQTYKGGTAPKLEAFDKPTLKGVTPAAQIEVVTPARDETFRSGERVVPVAVMVTPQLMPGQQLVYLLDGTPVSTPTSDTSFALTEVDRGTHTVTVALVDAAGETLATSPGVTFHMKPPTVKQAPTTPSPPPTKPKP
jgi:hypothetical protein